MIHYFLTECEIKHLNELHRPKKYSNLDLKWIQKHQMRLIEEKR